MRLGPGSRVGDRYTVLSSLGRGGVATVWLVRHDQLHTLHALKVLSLGSPRLHDRLVNEARIQAMLRHPNVVAAVDLVPFAGGVGLVLEYVAGPSLRAVLAQRRLDVAEADALFRGVAAGVACAHAAGLVHRDLKPANVLLQLEPTVAPKVTDFGLAKVWGDSGSGGSTATRTGATLGTPAYMAPEQVRDAANVDQRADVFALGAMAYELLTGVRCFEGEDTPDTLIRVKEARHVPLGERDPALPAALVEAVEGALTVDPDRRFPSVEAMLEVWGEHAVPNALARLKVDAAAIHRATPSVEPVDRTWTESDAARDEAAAAPPPATATATATAPRWPMWTLPIGAVGLFLAGMGVSTLIQGASQVDAAVLPSSPPVPAAVAPFDAPAAAPAPVGLPGPTEAQRAANELSLLMTDLSTDSIKGKKSLTWLREGLPGRVAEADRIAADIEARFPDDEAVLQARYYRAMVRFLAYSHLQWLSPPAGVDAEAKAEWERAIAEEFKPAALRSLDDARAQFEALSHTTHPKAAESLWPRMGRQMSAQIDEIPR